MAGSPRKNDTATIGQIAKAIGVPTSTVRYYERAGLLRPSRRTKAGYRLYDADAYEQLRFIRSAQSVGFSLQDIRALLTLDERTSCDQVQTLIQKRLDDVAGRIGDLQAVESLLKGALNRCRRSQRGCPVLGDLRRTKKRGKG